MKLSRFKISVQLVFILTGAIFTVCILFGGLSAYSLRSVVQMSSSTMKSIQKETEDSTKDMDKVQTEYINDVVDSSHTILTDLSVAHMKELSGGVAGRVKAEVETALDTARTLAKAVEGYKIGTPAESISRDSIIQLLLGIQKGHPNFAAVWIGFEPNALDGKDADYKGKATDYGCDPDGRFLPWLYMDKEKNAILPLEAPETTDYYAVPKKTKQEYVTDPYLYEGINMVSTVVPIIVEGNVIGVTGVDLSTEFIDTFLRKIKPYGESSYVYMVNEKSIFTWHPDEKFVAEKRNVGDVPGRERLAESIRKGEALDEIVKDLTTGKPLYQILSPLKFGRCPHAWGIVVAAEQEVVLANMTTIEKTLNDVNNRSSESFADMIAKIKRTNDTADQAFAQNNIKIVTTMIVAVAVMLLCAVVSAILVGRSFSVPIQEGIDVLHTIADQGLLKIDVPEHLLQRGDEIGKLGDCIEQILSDYRSLADMNQQLADHNWQLTAHVKSPDDTMNINLNTMLEQVNQALLEIKESVGQVITGASEVSSGASSLASGSQAAAASIEQISATMTEISDQTKANAQSASEARDLANRTSKAAGDGQKAMEEMTDAMGRITQNSEEIQRVIKVIDDIAFQTNLLALNAAVEAARAGQHGKGFAVVAEEVRNLAARSAKAAKETSELIAKSGHEIEQGGKVAGHTAEVLNTIVEQINKMTEIVGAIAAASSEQAQGVGQVTTGLHQIETVTQQNTAVAEESSSTANEMSSMATTLQNLVAQFKLREK